jgi:opacity protein-like surface antigen
MTQCRRNLIAAASVVVALSAVGTPARAEWIVTPPRTGQVGLSLQGQYGSMLKSGTIGKQFGNGPGLAVRLRYRMRYERGLGLSFESERFQARVASNADTAAKYATLYNYGVDVYQMFGTRTRTTKWLSVGIGLAQTRRTLNDKEIQFGLSNDGPYVSAAAGVERFIWQSWALDLSGRYLTVFLDRKPNHDFQASLGVIVYASY